MLRIKFQATRSGGTLEDGNKLKKRFVKAFGGREEVYFFFTKINDQFA